MSDKFTTFAAMIELNMKEIEVRTYLVGGSKVVVIVESSHPDTIFKELESKLDVTKFTLFKNTETKQ